MISKFWHHIKISLVQGFMCKIRNDHFKKLFLGENDIKKSIQVIAEQVLEIEEEKRMIQHPILNSWKIFCGGANQIPQTLIKIFNHKKTGNT